MKKPEEYLEEKVVAPEEGSGKQLSSMEQEFIKKYLTGEEDLDSNPAEQVDTAISFREQDLEPAEKQQKEHVPEPEQKKVKKEEKLDDSEVEQEQKVVKDQEKIQLVGFYLQNQEYTIPISDVKEVIKRIEPTEIPESPEYLLGVVNLKGKVTPLINLAYLLGKTDFDASRCGFIIIGQYQDLQVGIMVDRITTMHNIQQKDIDWTLDPYLTGGGKEFLTGLIRGDNLIGIISIKQIVDKIMQ